MLRSDRRRNASPVFVLLWCLVSANAPGQDAEAAAQPVPEAGVPIVYRGQEIVRIYHGIGGIGPVERARLTSERLNRLVRDRDFDPSRVIVTDLETRSEFVYEERLLGVVTDEDAKALGRSRSELAREVRERLVAVITATREEFSMSSIAAGLGWTLLATTMLALLLWLLARVSGRAEARARAWFQQWTDSRDDIAAFHSTRLGSLVHAAGRIATAGVALALVAMWLQVVLEVLPWSRPFARLIYRYAAAPVRTLWSGVLGIVPNLFYLAVIALVTFLVLRVVRVVFKEIEIGNIRLASFPDDWAQPTYRLIRALLLAMALVGAFPYIPGSQSPAFQGISLFLGLLLSFASSSALSNVIAGAVLTYTRAFRVGDIVRIGDTFGEVTMKRLLVTHVRTYKNIVVSIPNSVILTTQVLNYSTLAAQHGLVAHTSVTIGYAAPWQRVHELLIAAALRTEGVLENPPPFVLQTGLNDFSITYEINAFVASPLRLPFIYSALHANVQECFNEAGVEIMSPNYLALRDGNQATTPSTHLPPDYVAPAFRVHQEEAPDKERPWLRWPSPTPRRR
jgi:small-conductance mechanosensitive channel